MAVRSEDRFVVRALRALGQVEFTMVLLIGGALVMIAGRSVSIWPWRWSIASRSSLTSGPSS
jgi:hypothetical protein